MTEEERGPLVPAERVRGEDDPTRRLLLESGRQLLSEQGLGEAVEVKLTDACANVGLTTGAAYALWRSQAEYRADLARYVASTVEWAGPAAIADALAVIVAESPTIEEALHQAAVFYLERFCANEDFYLGLSFWAIRQPSEELVRSLSDNYRLASEGFADLFRAVLDHYGLDVRPEYTIEDLTVATIAATEGFALRRRVDPTAGAAEPELLTRVYAEALVALLHHFTRSAGRQSRRQPRDTA